MNLLNEGTFKPVTMHGRPSAARSWYLIDRARLAYESRIRKYLPGDKCFALDFKDGAMTVSFPDPLNPAYARQRMEFCSAVSRPEPPAPEYLVSGRVKLNRGKITLSNVKTFNSQPDWQSFSLKTKRPFDKFTIYPEAGAAFSVADFKCLAVYPKIGGAIKLPDGGKLTRLLLPENASYLMRWSIALWRGWLWKITGTALPIEIADAVKPVPGAFAAVKGKTAPGGWQLKIDKNGIVLTYGEEQSLAPALFDFLRGLGYAYYANDCVVELKSDPQRILPLTDKQVKPRYHYCIPEIMPASYMSGGTFYDNVILGNAVDWFHSPVYTSIMHPTNLILPMDIYGKSHPEYYMMNRDGKRITDIRSGLVSPCLSNPEAMRICVDNMIALALKQPPRPIMYFSIGDDVACCKCPACVKANGGTDSYSNLTMMFLNKVARGLAKKRPDMKICFLAYATCRKHLPAVKPEKNIAVNYAITLPCNLHTDCGMNRNDYDLLAKWSKYVGGRDRVGLMTYSDMRPLHRTAQLESMEKYAGNEVVMYYWKGYSPAIPFVTARWNLGEDPEKLLKEFNDHYYGKGGQFISQVDHLVKTFSQNYKHTPEELKKTVEARNSHFHIWGGGLNTRSALDRKTFDEIYNIFDRALAAVGADTSLRQRVLREKSFYLLEDLNKYRRNTCSNETELKGFIARLVDLIKIAREVPQLRNNTFYGVPGRSFLASVASLNVPNTGKPWALEPALEKILTASDPVKAFPMDPTVIPGGWYFDPVIFRGGSGVMRYGYQCSPKNALIMSRPGCGDDKISIEFNLKEKID
ncbi:MAG: DUF4838 domain-containing protein, partial [Victivallales bacterium]|nr:DUF4838 domain-containing protein [Victivallales bacterium]